MIYEIKAICMVPELSEYPLIDISYSTSEIDAIEKFKELINNEKTIHYATIEKITKTSKKIIRSYTK